MRKTLKFKITNKNEEEYIKSLQLQTETFIKNNDIAIRDKFYGSRLGMLLSLYNKKIEWVADVCLVNKSYVSQWIRNIRKPTPYQLSQLSLALEVPESFFTSKNILVRIEEQLILNMKEDV